VNRAVSVLIAVRSADKYNIDRKCLVEKLFLSVDLDELNDILCRLLVQFSALISRIHEGVQSDMSDRSDLVSGDITVHLSNNALRNIVCLDLVRERQVAELRSAVPVSADHTLNHALVTEVITARAVAMALARGEEQRHVLRMSCLKEPLLQCFGEGFRAGAADKTAGSDGDAVVNHCRGFFRSNNVYSFHFGNTSLLEKNSYCILRICPITSGIISCDVQITRSSASIVS
jgi:hypothetical protein